MKIPIFPLNGAIMFPKTNLPLNIFEERYIDMIDFALSNNRFLGMVQERSNKKLYDIGCYGKITVFNETNDKRYIINLEGLNCFKILREVETEYKFRVCEIEVFNNFNDYEINDGTKAKIIDRFEKYNKSKNINLQLEEISKLDIVDLLKFIVMISPFDFSLKQMFLELKSNKELYENVLSTLEIELASKEKTSTIN